MYEPHAVAGGDRRDVDRPTYGAESNDETQPLDGRSDQELHEIDALVKRERR